MISTLVTMPLRSDSPWAGMKGNLTSFVWIHGLTMSVCLYWVLLNYIYQNKLMKN